MFELPGHTFFTPTPYFWALLRGLYAHDIRVVDCGCGMGSLLDEAEREGCPMLGFDTHYREGQSVKVLRRDVLDLALWGPEVWPMVCRPSHGSWVDELMSRAQDRLGYGLYIGLPRNVKRDLPNRTLRKVSRAPVGVEGEHFYVVRMAGCPTGSVVNKLLRILPNHKGTQHGLPESPSGANLECSA